MVQSCHVCGLDTGGNHDWNCPNHPRHTQIHTEVSVYCARCFQNEAEIARLRGSLDEANEWVRVREMERDAIRERAERAEEDRDFFYETMVDLRENSANLSAVVEAVEKARKEGFCDNNIHEKIPLSVWMHVENALDALKGGE